jgi:hypothetical protein
LKKLAGALNSSSAGDKGIVPALRQPEGYKTFRDTQYGGMEEPNCLA